MAGMSGFSLFSISQAPDIDFDHDIEAYDKIEANKKRATRRILLGLVCFVPITVLLTVAGFTAGGVVWAAFVGAGPVVLLALARFRPLANWPIGVVVLCFVPCVIWGFYQAGFHWWAAAVLFVYLWGFEEILSGLELRHYIAGYESGVPAEAVEYAHAVSKTRIWGYLLASAAIGFGGFRGLESMLLFFTLLALLVQWDFAMRFLDQFSYTRWIPGLSWRFTRQVNIGIAAMNILLMAYASYLLLSGPAVTARHWVNWWVSFWSSLSGWKPSATTPGSTPSNALGWHELQVHQHSVLRRWPRGGRWWGGSRHGWGRGC